MIKYFFSLSVSISFLLLSCTEVDIDSSQAPSTNEIDQISTTEDIDTQDLTLASFTIDNKNSKVFEKESLLITNNSQNAVSYLWDFGNGDTSADAIPEYTYENHGIFTIKLSITDSYGNVETTSQDITVICLFDNEDHDNF